MKTLSSQEHNQSKPQKLLEQVHKSNWFQFLLNEVQLLQHLQKILIQVLEPAVANKCWIVEFKNNKLILELENQALSTRLRFQSMELLKSLKIYAEFKDLKKIEFRVKIFSNPYKREAPQPQRIPDESLEILKKTAESIEDETLRNALLRLARRK